jgi:2'-5' RNA ligase
MHRLFVAIRPPPAVRNRLLALMHGVEGARWQDEAQLHLTLRFIGEVDRHVAADIADALARIAFPPFDLALAGVGTFDRRGRIDTLWAGVVPPDDLAGLHRKVDRARVAAGVAPDDRAYRPHVTLARLNSTGGRIDGFLQANAGIGSQAFTVEEFGLYESMMGRSGSVYHLVERYPLAAPRPLA